MATSSECVFCQIVQGKIPCHKIYEDEHYLAFMDIYPISHGHTLVVPKIHCDSIFDLDEKIYSGAFLVAKKLSKPIQKTTNCVRVCILVEGYFVPHAHIKLIPNNLATDLGNDTKPGSTTELEKMAQKIRQHL